jgi:hypothetical protein
MKGEYIASGESKSIGEKPQLTRQNDVRGIEIPKRTIERGDQTLQPVKRELNCQDHATAIGYSKGSDFTCLYRFCRTKRKKKTVKTISMGQKVRRNVRFR